MASPSLSAWERELLQAERAHEKLQQRWSNLDELELFASEGLTFLKAR